MTKSITPLHTSCDNCIFAQWYDNVQTGCKFSRLQKAKKNNIEIIEVYNNEKEFYVLNNIKCHYKRDNNWAAFVKEKDRQDRVHRENRIKYQAIIFAPSDLSSISLTVKSLCLQDIKPQHITIVHEPDSQFTIQELSQYLYSQELPWSIHDIYNTQEQNEYDIIDTIVRAKLYPYYTVLFAGEQIPQQLFTQINDHIYDKNLRFAILEQNSLWPMVVSTSIHVVYGGNKPSTLRHKLINDKHDNFILDINTICKI